jgi:hypothetical protein
MNEVIHLSGKANRETSFSRALDEGSRSGKSYEEMATLCQREIGRFIEAGGKFMSPEGSGALTADKSFSTLQETHTTIQEKSVVQCSRKPSKSTE